MPSADASRTMASQSRIVWSASSSRSVRPCVPIPPSSAGARQSPTGAAGTGNGWLPGSVRPLATSAPAQRPHGRAHVDDVDDDRDDADDPDEQPIEEAEEELPRCGEAENDQPE